MLRLVSDAFLARSKAPGPVSRRGIRSFHDYFVAHLPSSSLHPEERAAAGFGHHRLPRDKSTVHATGQTDAAPSVAPAATGAGASRDTTVVRIPIRHAKHHLGVSISRGTRAHNEDAYQAGTIAIPAFARRRPVSWNREKEQWGKSGGRPDGDGGNDPQVFYYGVFDGHGGNECSDFLREQLHAYIEDAAVQFQLTSILAATGAHSNPATGLAGGSGETVADGHDAAASSKGQVKKKDPEELQKRLLLAWKSMVGGYFRRFKPDYFSSSAGGRGDFLKEENFPFNRSGKTVKLSRVGIETVFTYAFLKADFDFVAAQVKKEVEDAVLADRALNEGDIADQQFGSARAIGGPKRFVGGSTCSLLLISTPTPAPYWDPTATATLLTAHVGDTRILLCNTKSGAPTALTAEHHPSQPAEARRLRRYAGSLVTDSFGEERVTGLANSRAFGDVGSKRYGVSAEPDIRLLEIGPAEYSFAVLVSDGVSGTLSDQEIVDVAKEAKTPEQAAAAIVSFATEVADEADNSTAIVVRLGGWERRAEGGVGSLGTKELRDYRRQDAQTPRRRT